MTPADWATQVATAAAAGIDAFALDIALDSYTDTQLGYAYAAAANHGNFGCFLQFDFAAASGQGGFTQAGVVNTINNYKSRAGQYTYQGKPLVSTFEGTDDASWWPDIKSQTGCVFAPDYTSLGPQNAASQPGVDGYVLLVFRVSPSPSPLSSSSFTSPAARTRLTNNPQGSSPGTPGPTAQQTHPPAHQPGNPPSAAGPS